MKRRIVHVARDGQVIGQYPPDQIAPLVEAGTLRSGDFAYSESLQQWTPIEEFLKKAGTGEFSRLKPAAGSLPPKRTGSSRRSSRRSRPASMIGGWIAFLLALAALAGSGFWIAALYGELRSKGSEIEQLKSQLSVKEKENQRLLFVAREIAEPGTVRGSFILRESGKRVAVPGVEVSLYARQTVEDHLDRRFAAASVPPNTSVPATNFLLENIPNPIARTSTDARGRFEFQVPEPGEYVLVATCNTAGTGDPSLRLWFVSFDSRDSLNTLVEINESNAVQQLVRSLMIVQGR